MTAKGIRHECEKAKKMKAVQTSGRKFFTCGLF